jgi:serine protease Do
MNRRSVSDDSSAAYRLATILGIAIFSFGSPSPVLAAPNSDETRLCAEISDSLGRLGREKSQALVRIRCRDEAGEIIGTGFLIDPAGTVCTLSEFVRSGCALTVEQGGRSFPASLLSADGRTGIAFLRTPVAAPAFISPFPAATLGMNSPVEQLSPTPSGDGAVPLLGTTGTRIDHDGERFFAVPLITARLAAGSRPGTPVFSLSGKFAGIVVRREMEDGTCAILPASAVEKLHGDLLRFGKPNPGWIGAAVEESAVPEGSSRTRIAAVEPGSPAEKAGIRPGDALISIGERTIVMPQEVLESSFYLTAGENVRLVLSRNGELRRITLRCAPVPGEEPLLRE